MRGCFVSVALIAFFVALGAVCCAPARGEEPEALLQAGDPAVESYSVGGDGVQEGMRDEGEYFVYRTGPVDTKMQEEEKLKQELAWEMLMNSLSIYSDTSGFPDPGVNRQQ